MFTVFANVFEHGGLKAGVTLLVHGATSGIGTTAIQMAKAAGAKVIATASGAAKAAEAKALGADMAVDATAQDFAEVAKAQGGVDVVLDMVGGDYFLKDLDALRTGGRIVFIAFSGEELNLFGSKHYAENPLYPLDKTAIMINMDMIGRSKPVDDNGTLKDRLVVYGHGTAEGLERLVDFANANYNFKMFKVAGGVGPSDHASFYRKKIPVLFFFTGTHPDYHKPTDTADKINYAGLAQVVEREAGTLAGLHRRPALEVGQGEVALAVAAVGGAQQREQRGVLRDRQQLAVAPGPAPRREVERENSDFSDKWISHGTLLSWLRLATGKCRTAK